MFSQPNNVKIELQKFRIPGDSGLYGLIGAYRLTTTSIRPGLRIAMVHTWEPIHESSGAADHLKLVFSNPVSYKSCKSEPDNVTKY